MDRVNRILSHLQVAPIQSSLSQNTVAYNASATHPASLKAATPSGSKAPCHPASIPGLADALFVGFDLSTQGLKLDVTTADSKTVYSYGVNFDKDLSHYGTSGGALKKQESAGMGVTAPTLMFVEAMDMVLTAMGQSGKVDCSKIVAVSSSGQQHGSVYWKNGSRSVLNSLSADALLKTQLQDAFALPAGAIWMDSSTTAYCKAMEQRLGGAQAVASLSGSRAYERFTGHQISKVIQTNPAGYANTERIALVSSFCTSLLVGDYAAIDNSDGSGMNLMDINTEQWAPELLEACVAVPGLAGDAGSVKSRAASLAAKLGPVEQAHRVAGLIHHHFVQRYGWNPNCVVVHATGDNPSSLAGLQLEEAGDVAISMGTSDTLFAVMPAATMAPNGEEGHIFRNPIDVKSCMAMLCYKNGSLAREKARNGVGVTSWPDFGKALMSRPVGNEGNLGIFFYEPEIIPACKKTGVYRFGPNGSPQRSFSDAATEIRAVVEGQFLSMRLHSQGVGLHYPKRVIATGGGSVNTDLLQIISNVFDSPVYASSNGPNSASAGAAYRALHGFMCQRSGKVLPFGSIFPSSGSDTLKLMASPQPAAVKVYKALLPRYAQCEKQVLAQA